MSEKGLMLIAYSTVFTTFNLLISIFYNVYGLIVYKRKYRKLTHTSLTKSEKKYLSDTKFVNVRRDWLKKFYIKIRNGSILYFVISEIVCFLAIYITAEYVLVCRIALTAAILLLVIWVFLLLYVKKNNKRLSAEHQKNLDNALKELYKNQNTEQGE